MEIQDLEKKYNKNLLRELARSYYWQVKYKHSKELGFELFKNKSELTNIQLQFLQWLELYATLYEDLAGKEEFIQYFDNKGNEKSVIDHDIYCDAYVYWRRNCKYKKDKETTEKSEDDKAKGFQAGEFILPKKLKVMS